MEFSTEEFAPQKNSPRGGNANKTGLIVFVVAVVAVLIYASQQEHGAGTLVALCAVLLAGEIFAVIQWRAESGRLATEDAAKPLLDAFDLRMRQSFANQEIIHKEVHDDFEALSKRLETLERALAAKNETSSAAEKIDDLAYEVEKFRDRQNAFSEEFSKQLDDAIFEAAHEASEVLVDEIEKLGERLDALAEAQGEILEKLDAVFDAANEAETAEILDDENLDTGDEFDSEENSDEAFPLPENMLERAREANAATAASAAAKLIANVPATIVLIEYFSKNEPAKPAESAAVPAAETPKPFAVSETTSVPAEPQRRPFADDELPLFEEDLPHTALILKAEFGIGERPFLRGKAPGVPAGKSVPMDLAGANLWRFDFGPMREDVEITLFRNDTNEALGEPFRLRAGKVTTLAFSPNA